MTSENMAYTAPTDIVVSHSDQDGGAYFQQQISWQAVLFLFSPQGRGPSKELVVSRSST